MKVSAKFQRFPKHCLLILYSHVRLCAAAALAGAAVAWKSLQKCPRRPDRLEWVCEPASAAGRRKVGQPAGPSCKIRHLTSPLYPFHDPGYILHVQYVLLNCSPLFTPLNPPLWAQLMSDPVCELVSACEQRWATVSRKFLHISTKFWPRETAALTIWKCERMIAAGRLNKTWVFKFHWGASSPTASHKSHVV